MILRVAALQTNTLHLSHPRSAGDRFLLRHPPAAMTALFALTKIRFGQRNRLPRVHSVDPKVVRRKKAAGLHETVEIVLSILPDFLPIT